MNVVIHTEKNSSFHLNLIEIDTLLFTEPLQELILVLKFRWWCPFVDYTPELHFLFLLCSLHSSGIPLAVAGIEMNKELKRTRVVWYFFPWLYVYIKCAMWKSVFYLQKPAYFTNPDNFLLLSLFFVAYLFWRWTQIHRWFVHQYIIFQSEDNILQGHVHLLIVECKFWLRIF